jgi:hypothetical protein
MYACQFDYIGVQSPNFWFVPDTTQRVPLGTLISAADPFWGGAEFVYGQATGTISAFNLCSYQGAQQFTALANTANTGRSVAVALAALTVGQFGWFYVYGAQVPVTVTASVAAGTTFGITGAGTAGANTAGKQILNAVSSAPSSTTVVKANVQTTNGSAILVTQGYDGWFPGVALSGTGISGTVLSVSPDGRTVTASANATATGSISATGTYTGFILAEINRPLAQGAIT